MKYIPLFNTCNHKFPWISYGEGVKSTIPQNSTKRLGICLCSWFYCGHLYAILIPCGVFILTESSCFSMNLNFKIPSQLWEKFELDGSHLAIVTRFLVLRLRQKKYIDPVFPGYSLINLNFFFLTVWHSKWGSCDISQEDFSFLNSTQMRLPKGNPGYIKQKADTHEIPLFSCEVKYKHNIQALNEIHWKWINLLKKEIHWALLFIRTISLKVLTKIIKTHFWLGLRGRKVIFLARVPCSSHWRLLMW